MPWFKLEFDQREMREFGKCMERESRSFPDAGVLLRVNYAVEPMAMVFFGLNAVGTGYLWACCRRLEVWVG